MRARDDGKRRERAVKNEVKTTDTVCRNAKDRMGRARGPGRHGGEAPAMCVGTDDVGLDSLVLSYQEESTKKAAAIDARQRAGKRLHDMAAGAIRTLMQYPPKQLMTIRGTLTVIRVKQITNDNSL